MIVEAIAREGVDARWVLRDDAPTGLFCKWRTDGQRASPTAVLAPLRRACARATCRTTHWKVCASST